jgi:3-(3-hydroxy-phenyl)propionate hydroxylase
MPEPVAPASGASTYRAVTARQGYEFASGSGYTLPEYPFVAPPALSDPALGRVETHDIVIVGGGVSGLTLACALARMGVAAVLVDEDNTVGVKGASSRGICYAQKSLEIFQRLGLYERIAAKGVQWSVGRTFAGHDEVYAFDLRQQATHSLSEQPPFINIQQFYIEGFLVERLAALGVVDLRWQTRVTGFSQTDHHATLQVETPQGGYTLRARHVVDATGVHSPFRQWLNVTVNAKKGDDRWCIADVRFKTKPPAERHTWIEAPFNENRAVWQHLMADDVWRLDYQMAPNCDMAYVAREDVVKERLKRQFGDGFDPDRDCEIVWVGPYAYRSECLETFRVGRVFFVGDSAHVVSPFGARGGNSGLQDGDNLAWKLAAEVQGRAGPALLASYDTERREAARQNVQVTNRTARFLRPQDGAERLFRSATLALARQHAFARQMVNTGRMSTANPYPGSELVADEGLDGQGLGLSVQNAHLVWADGRHGCLNELLAWASQGGPRLLGLGLSAGGVQQLLVARQALAGDTLRIVRVEKGARDRAPKASASLPRETVFDPGEALRHACQAAEATWAVLRPDGYLVAAGTKPEHLARALRVGFGHGLAPSRSLA